MSRVAQGSLGGANQGERDAWVAKYSAAGALLWTRQLGTSEGDYPLGVATDGDGNVYISGWTVGSLGGANQGRGDAWVAKYSAEGALLWARQLGTSAEDVSSGVATDGDGNVYISGGTYGSLGGPNRGRFDDAWVAKYSAEGALLWARQLGTSVGDHSSGVATDGDGNVYISGGTAGSLGGPNPGGYPNVFVAKYSAEGALRWKRQLGTSGFSSGIATDDDGNIYISGWAGDAIVAKYSAAGRLRWTRQLGTSEEDSSSAVATDGHGNLYISGWTAGSLGGANEGGFDAFVAKYFTRR
jgi:hypothetical protein